MSTQVTLTIPDIKLQEVKMTLTQQEVVTTLRAQLPYLQHKYGVKKLGLFGSVAQNQARAESDVDLVVEFSQPIGLDFMTLVDELSVLLGKPIDLLPLSDLKLIRWPQVAQTIEETIVYV